MEFMGSCKNKETGLGGLGDCEALFFLALPSESSASLVTSQTPGSCGRGMPSPARPGRLRRHQRFHAAAVPGEAPGGG